MTKTNIEKKYIFTLEELKFILSNAYCIGFLKGKHIKGFPEFKNPSSEEIDIMADKFAEQTIKEADRRSNQ